MAYNVAVDVGGTFTDVLVFDEETGELTEGKVLSTPERLDAGERGPEHTGPESDEVEGRAVR